MIQLEIIESLLQCYNVKSYQEQLYWREDIVCLSTLSNFAEAATGVVPWKAVLKNFATFTGKQLSWSLFLIKLQVWRPATLLKKTLQHSCFPVNIAKFLRTPHLKNTCERVFLTLANFRWTCLYFRSSLACL